jgi:transcriptional regulator GlxA family with amidase domain
MVRKSGLTERTFKRRFQSATGFTPIEYVQLERIEAAKHKLERSNDAIDEISWQVGYEDAAFFRRLFKRVTNLTPGAFRRHYRMPEELAAAAQSARVDTRGSRVA